MITLILGVFHHFCKSARSASRQRENFVESLHSGDSATYLLIIWVEKVIPLSMKSKQKPYPSIVFLSIFVWRKLVTAHLVCNFIFAYVKIELPQPSSPPAFVVPPSEADCVRPSGTTAQPSEDSSRPLV